MTLITSLNLAAMRGVRVQIVLPEVNNLPVVKWASMAQLWQMLLRGCEIYRSPPPFDHSKIMVVDDEPGMLRVVERILRSNYDVECFSSPEKALAALDESGETVTGHYLTTRDDELVTRVPLMYAT